MNEFLVVAVGRGQPRLVARALESIATQDDKCRVHVVIDHSEDDMTEALAPYRERFAIFQTKGRRYALANQVMAWRAFEPQDDDVVVFVDLDDRLARPDALALVRSYYDQGALMTYGSYRAVPEEHPNAKTCRPAKPYPPLIVNARAYRQVVPHFNHLRTVAWKLLKQLTEYDLRNDEGTYWLANTDRAVMYPCLEMAGERAVFIPEVLYEYTCNNEESVVRTMLPQLIREDNQIRARARKERV